MHPLLLLGGFVRPHDLAVREPSRLSRCSAKGVDLLPLLLTLFQHLALFRRSYVEKVCKGRSLFLALVGELLVRGSLLICLPLSCSTSR